MRIDRDHVVSTLTDLVRIPSVNPAFGDHTGSEAAIANYVARALEESGLEVTRYEPEPGRVSVAGWLRGTGRRSLMLYAHLDTVGVEGMHDPFAADIRDGRMYGRGAYDMKGGLAACLAAARALRDEDLTLEGDLVVAAVADEETASLGMLDLLSHVRTDAAIVTEPTELELCLAHKGFVWMAVETAGRAAHGSRFDEGVDANMRMGRFLARLDRLEQALRGATPHPLVGPPSLHAAVLQGGTGTSTYAARCRLEIERRTIPGETEALVLEQVQQIADRLAEEDPTFKAQIRSFLTRPPFEALSDSPVVAAVRAAGTEVLGRTPPAIGHSYWMDAALLAETGIDTVVIGPAGAGAHAAEEWVELESVAQLAEILAAASRRFLGTSAVV